MAKLEPYKGGYYLWQYLPSLAAAAIFTIAFIAATGMHFVRLSQWRARFCLPFAIGGIFEIIGYAARAWAHFSTGSIMPYSIQSVFILLGPVLFAASVYMTLGRIIRSTGGEHLSMLLIRWLTKTFVLGDVVSFLVQGGAAGMMASGSNATLGKDMVVVGLLIQIIMFGFFMVTAVMFQIRLQGRPTPGAVDGRIDWREHLYLLYGVSLFIMVRSLFRVVEYVLGNTGYPLTHEWTLYIFDAVLMVLAMVAWLVWYPAKLARPDMGLEMLSREERD
ncbi:RTA1 domain-containing protein [Aspergillus ibericus CBS 121593]|uniref:RTA1-domain-containing protein n=1 Tax=Aspergillus ibericus CBS 121593 TaxID=1448316 RepID=A0A395HFG2_9EURO|nr:RTA1-domain-containing protein [Aspergillus ibericus CBS 121593]RAL04964.1 RTA1-domain-containing protein [Aspergillus ibericus CBS 121593]